MPIFVDLAWNKCTGGKLQQPEFNTEDRNGKARTFRALLMYFQKRIRFIFTGREYGGESLKAIQAGTV